MDNNELRHYGILGMKWGVRRTEAQLARARGKVSELENKLERKTGSSKKASPSTPDSAPKKRSVKEMSDDELRSKIQRLQMEKQLKQLSEEGSTVKDKGKSAVGGFLKSAGKKVLVDTAVDVSAQVVKYFMTDFANKKLNVTEKVKNHETGEFEDIIKEVVYTNNKKK
jgi:hypothetical protein